MKGIVSSPHATILYPFSHITEINRVDIIPKIICGGSELYSFRARSKKMKDTNIAAVIITGGVMFGMNGVFVFWFEGLFAPWSV